MKTDGRRSHIRSFVAVLAGLLLSSALVLPAQVLASDTTLPVQEEQGAFALATPAENTAPADVPEGSAVPAAADTFDTGADVSATQDEAAAAGQATTGDATTDGADTPGTPAADTGTDDATPAQPVDMPAQPADKAEQPTDTPADSPADTPVQPEGSEVADDAQTQPASDVPATPDADADEQEDSATAVDAEGSTDEAVDEAADEAANDDPQHSDANMEGRGDDGQIPVVKSVAYRGHVQNIGWQDYVKDGANAGTSGKALRVEALRIKLLDDKGKLVKGISYQAHVQNIGWQNWVSDDAVAGTSGKSYRVEAIRIKLSDELAKHYDIYYRVHAQNVGWMAWAKNGAMAGTQGRGYRLEAVQILLVEKGAAAPSSSGSDVSWASNTDPTIAINAHVENIGWQGNRTYGAVAGTTGRGLRVEAIKATLAGSGVKGGISYQAHVQNIGWQGVKSNGAVAGTSGRSLRVEAMRFKLTGEAEQKYDVYYRAHVQSLGWLGWTKNWEIAGTTGLGFRVEAFEVRLVPKGAAAPNEGTSNISDTGRAKYQVKLQGEKNFQAWKNNGQTAGTTGQAKRLSELCAQVSFGEGIQGGIRYAVAANGKWGGFVTGDTTAVSPVSGKPLEAVKVELTGDAAKYFDVYYRVHSSNVGWLDWAKNGAAAGTLGLGYPMEAVQIKVVVKGVVPGETAAPFYGKNSPQLQAQANSRQKRVVSSAKSTPSPGGGLCAGWVTNVFSRAGFGTFGGDACDMFNWYCTTSDLSQLKVGMIVAVSSHGNTYLGSIYGHVCVYIGNGMVMDNTGQGEIRTARLSWWLDRYGDRMRPQWGWLGNVRLD